MFRFSGYIFNEFFTLFDKRTDPNKDAEEKGTQERFQEIFEDELDEGVLPLVENLQVNIYQPQQAYDRYIPYIASMLGYDLSFWSGIGTGDFNNDFSDDFLITSGFPWPGDLLSFRRNLVDILTRLYSIRGTAKLYTIMFSWLGFTAVITDIDPSPGTFDLDGGTFDMTGHTFDMGCPGCSKYSIDLSGSYEALSDAQISAIANIINFNEPINAVISQITYNGAPV